MTLVGVRQLGSAVRRRAVPAALAAGPPAVALAAFAVQVGYGGQIVRNYFVVDVVLAVANSVLGALLVSRLPGNRIGWLFCLSGAAYAGASGATAWLTVAQHQGWPGVTAAAWVGEWAFVLALYPQLSLLLLLFPDGRPPTPRWRPVMWVAVVGMAGLTGVFMLAPELHINEHELVTNPIGVRWADALVVPLFAVLVAAGIASAAGLVLRVRRAGPDERRRIAPYVATGVVVAVAMLASAPLPVSDAVVQTLVLPLLPAAATICILRYRLYDLELIVRRSLVWAGLTVFVVAGYVLVVQAAANLLHTGVGWPTSVLATAAVAAAFQPARLWLQRIVSRSLYGHREDPYQALARLGQTVAFTAEPVGVLQRVADDVAAALAVPWVGVRVAAGSVAEAGERPAWADAERVLEIPLVHAGDTVGALLVSRRSPNERLSAPDRALLKNLSFSVGAAVAAFLASRDLRRSREQLVSAREEERRRLRNDLHDGLGPLLAAVGTQLETANMRLPRDPDRVPELLHEARAVVDDALATLRRVVDDLRPPALDELGLVLAIREQAHRLRPPDGPRITVDGDSPIPLAAATEVAAFRIALEAITNALRHARAGSVDVRLTRDEGDQVLSVDVADDGVGDPQRFRANVGLLSMRARAEELGGEFAIGARTGGGTVVHAALPLDPALS